MIPKKALISTLFWRAVLCPADSNTPAEIPFRLSGGELFLFAAHLRLSGQQPVLFTVWHTTICPHFERYLKKTCRGG